MKNKRYKIEKVAYSWVLCATLKDDTTDSNRTETTGQNANASAK